MEKLDVSGLSCPIPVLRTKKAIDSGIDKLNIIGSTQVSRENVEKFAKSQGFTVDIVAIGEDHWEMIVQK